MGGTSIAVPATSISIGHGRKDHTGSVFSLGTWTLPSSLADGMDGLATLDRRTATTDLWLLFRLVLVEGADEAHQVPEAQLALGHEVLQELLIVGLHNNRLQDGEHAVHRGQLVGFVDVIALQQPCATVKQHQLGVNQLPDDNVASMYRNDLGLSSRVWASHAEILDALDLVDDNLEPVADGSVPEWGEEGMLRLLARVRNANRAWRHGDLVGVDRSSMPFELEGRATHLPEPVDVRCPLGEDVVDPGT